MPVVGYPCDQEIDPVLSLTLDRTPCFETENLRFMIWHGNEILNCLFRGPLDLTTPFTENDCKSALCLVKTDPKQLLCIV
jgi:hypothetical protein